jgi:predicted dehydrogenase
MHSKTIQWGIIGCGNVTEVKSGPAFSKVPHSKLIAVMRRNAAKAADYAQRHGVEKWYSDASALINDPNVNAIYIATPPSSHEAYTTEALQAGKPVYVEKPMAVNAAAAGRMSEVAKSTGVKLSVAHYRREQPLFLKIKSLLEEGAIGEVRLINLRFFQPHRSPMIAQTEEPWRLDPAVSGGGLFHDLAPHQLDLMRYLFGRPRQSSGVSFNAAQLYAADDTVSGQVLFDKAVLFNGVWCFTSSQKKDHCEIIGTEGSIHFSVFEQQPVVLIKNGTEQHFHFEPLPHVQQPMIQKVVAYFLGTAPNPCSADEGVDVMKMMEGFTLHPVG